MYVPVFSDLFFFRELRTTLDIIVLLALGVILIMIFVLWQLHLERVHNDHNAPFSLLLPPPLVKMSLWTRANGRFGVMMFIVFLTWCTFVSWAFWVQVLGYSFPSYGLIEMLLILASVVLSRLRWLLSYPHDSAFGAHVCLRHRLQRRCRSYCRACTNDLSRRSVPVMFL